MNQNLSKFLKDNGVVHKLTCVDTPQQNEVAERKNRHHLEVARALLFQISVPKSYWGEAVIPATYLINRLPSHVLNGVSLIQLMTTFYPSVPILTSLQTCVFGCPVFVHVHSPHREKLDPLAIKCVFIGYASKRGTNVITFKVIVSMFPMMSLFMKHSISSVVLSFRERVPRMSFFMKHSISSLVLNFRGRVV